MKFFLFLTLRNSKFFWPLSFKSTVNALYCARSVACVDSIGLFRPAVSSFCKHARRPSRRARCKRRKSTPLPWHHVCVWTKSIYTLTFQNFYQALLGNALLEEKEKEKEIKVEGGGSLPLSPLSSRKKAWDCPYPLLRRPPICHSAGAVPPPSSLLPFPPAPRTPGTHHTLPRGTYGLESSAASHDKPKHSPDATAKPPRSAATANVSVAQCIAHRASTPESHWPQINPRGRYAGLQTPHCCSCAGPHAPGRRQSPFQRCLCRTRRRGSRGQRRVTYERTRVIKP